MGAAAHVDGFHVPVEYGRGWKPEFMGFTQIHPHCPQEGAGCAPYLPQAVWIFSVDFVDNSLHRATRRRLYGKAQAETRAAAGKMCFRLEAAGNKRVQPVFTEV